jgi:hypothetical protein
MTISFRDPDGRLVLIDDRVLRIVNKTGAANLNAFLASAVAKQFVAAGQLARTGLPGADSVKLLFEYLQHETSACGANSKKSSRRAVGDPNGLITFHSTKATPRIILRKSRLSSSMRSASSSREMFWTLGVTPAFSAKSPLAAAPAWSPSTRIRRLSASCGARPQPQA